jgi:hypothetical protein
MGDSDTPAAAAPRYIPVDRKQLRLEPLDVDRLVDDNHPTAAKGRELHLYSASSKDCEPCRARQLCCPKLNLANGGRSVSFTIHDPAIEAFDAKMRQPEALEIYKQRAPLAEFPNAWIKAKLKLRRFATRGLTKVKCEAL